MKSLFKLLACILVIFTLTLTTTSCGKYEDGPSISLRSKKARLTGEWSIESVTFNGTDNTSAYTTLLGSNYILEIEGDGTYKTKGNSPSDGTWKFGEDKDDVYFKGSASGSTEVANRILRLANKELWLKSTASNGDVTIVKYKQ